MRSCRVEAIEFLIAAFCQFHQRKTIRAVEAGEITAVRVLTNDFRMCSSEFFSEGGLAVCKIENAAEY